MFPTSLELKIFVHVADYSCKVFVSLQFELTLCKFCSLELVLRLQ